MKDHTFSCHESSKTESEDVQAKPMIDTLCVSMCVFGGQEYDERNASVVHDRRVSVSI